MDVARIRTTFGLTRNELARSLGVATFTVSRWEAGTSKPVGLQREVLTALGCAAESIGRPAAKTLGRRLVLALLLDDAALNAPTRRGRKRVSQATSSGRKCKRRAAAGSLSSEREVGGRTRSEEPEE